MLGFFLEGFDMRHGKLLTIITAGLLGGAVSTVSGAPVVLSDLNSSVLVDPTSQGGMSQWNMDGVNQLFQQWFWYRVGTTGPEASIDTIPQTGQNVLNTNFNPGNDTLATQYTSPLGFRVTVTYLLTGGNAGSQTSDVAESIKIDNLLATPLDMHFFQYSDFDLGGINTGDTATITGGNTARVTKGGSILEETVATPMPDHKEVAFLPTTLNKLNDAGPTTLSDNVNPMTGDTTFAFQWDANIPAGGSFIISKDKNIKPIPEPASIGLLAGAAVLLAFRRRRA